jgi:hypothetical protein
VAQFFDIAVSDQFGPSLNKSVLGVGGFLITFAVIGELTDVEAILCVVGMIEGDGQDWLEGGLDCIYMVEFNKDGVQLEVGVDEPGSGLEDVCVKGICGRGTF